MLQMRGTLALSKIFKNKVQQIFFAEPLANIGHMRKQLDDQQSLGVQTKETLGLILSRLESTQAAVESTQAAVGTLQARFVPVKAGLKTLQARLVPVEAGIKTLQTDMTSVSKIASFTSNQVAHIRRSISNDFEFLCAAWVKDRASEFFKVDIPHDAFGLRRHLTDTEGIIDPSKKGRAVDVEIDILCEEPALVAAESVVYIFEN